MMISLLSRGIGERTGAHCAPGDCALTWPRHRRARGPDAAVRAGRYAVQERGHCGQGEERSAAQLLVSPAGGRRGQAQSVQAGECEQAGRHDEFDQVTMQ